jgi:outer membrane protein assembly factor BamB
VKSASLLKLNSFAAIVWLVGSLTGCTMTGRSKPESNKTALVPVNSLAKAWTLPLNLPERGDSIRGIYLRDDMVFAVSQRNRVTAMSAADGKPLWAADVKPDEVHIKPPVLIKENVAFPAGSSIEVYSKAGKFIDSADTKRSIRSGGAALENTIYLGLDYPAGGRLAAIDLTRRFDRARWELMIRSGISAAPAVHQNNIYFADESGSVYAVSEEKAPIWPLEHSAFHTDGRIVADVKADEGGVYVASMDSKLYCVDTGSGRLRWQYYASTPLVESPVITADTVYQVVPNVGVAAIPKSSGELNRSPKWIAKGATRFVAQDDKHAYLVGPNNQIMACDRQTGEVRFKSQRQDLVAFAINTKTSMIFASTRDGTVIGIKPVTTPGTVGTIVLAPVSLDQALALGRAGAR